MADDAFVFCQETYVDLIKLKVETRFKKVQDIYYKLLQGSFRVVLFVYNLTPKPLKLKIFLSIVQYLGIYIDSHIKWEALTEYLKKNFKKCVYFLPTTTCFGKTSS